MDYYKVERSISYKDKYSISPTYYMYEVIDRNKYEFPLSTIELISKVYNYTLKDLFKYLISTHNAEIYMAREYPYFELVFPSKSYADTFCKELNLRQTNILE